MSKSAGTVPEVLYMKYKSEFKHGFTNPEAVVWTCSIKMVFLKIFENSRESTCTSVSFLIKLQVSVFFL